MADLAHTLYDLFPGKKGLVEYFLEAAEKGVVDIDKHWPLLRFIDTVSAQSNLPKLSENIFTSMKEGVSENIRAWAREGVTRFKQQESIKEPVCFYELDYGPSNVDYLVASYFIRHSIPVLRIEAVTLVDTIIGGITNHKGLLILPDLAAQIDFKTYQDWQKARIIEHLDWRLDHGYPILMGKRGLANQNLRKTLGDRIANRLTQGGTAGPKLATSNQELEK